MWWIFRCEDIRIGSESSLGTYRCIMICIYVTYTYFLPQRNTINIDTLSGAMNKYLHLVRRRDVHISPSHCRMSDVAGIM